MSDQIREASWTGSESDRTEQRICLPPTKEARKTPRFLIPANTFVEVSHLSPLRWRNHQTHKDISSERYESYRNGYYTFREEGFFVRVHRADEAK